MNTQLTAANLLEAQKAFFPLSELGLIFSDETILEKIHQIYGLIGDYTELYVRPVKDAPNELSLVHQLDVNGSASKNMFKYLKENPFHSDNFVGEITFSAGKVRMKVWFIIEGKWYRLCPAYVTTEEPCLWILVQVKRKLEIDFLNSL